MVFNLSKVTRLNVPNQLLGDAGHRTVSCKTEFVTRHNEWDCEGSKNIIHVFVGFLKEAKV